MVWITPRTWTTNERIYNFMLNNEIRDRLRDIRRMWDAACCLSKTDDQSIGISTYTAVTWNRTLWNRGSIHDEGDTENVVSAFTQTGLWGIAGRIHWGGSSEPGRRAVATFIDNLGKTDNLDSCENTDDTTNEDPVQGFYAQKRFTTEDSLAIRVEQKGDDGLSVMGDPVFLKTTVFCWFIGEHE